MSNLLATGWHGGASENGGEKMEVVEKRGNLV
jgi:hypothetical protein